MQPEDRDEKLQRLFAEGVDLTGDAQAAFLERVLQHEEPGLAQELEALLAVRATRLEGFLNAPPTRAQLLRTPTVSPTPPPSIPGYVDLECIGEGGMGTVFRAQQLEPMRRTVAIKTIRVGADSRQVKQRFEIERHALARMKHPSIATVYDAGNDAVGRPYLVLEYVEGEPITDYCERHELDLRARLQMFVLVCEAIEHAHQRGVLHRDLKPSNVLVTDAGSEAIPKVIDFGIAKSVQGRLVENSLHTMEGALLGTPEYMSPEQLDSDAGVVDTRTDVYALGILLYELITGTRPFDGQRLRDEGLTSWMRIVRDEVPQRPSLRIATQERGHMTRTRRFGSDLDWVALRALEKEPSRRYQSPREFGADIGRYLADLPVDAGPPGRAYRFRKFVRRHRAWVVGGVAVVLALAIGLVATAILAVQNDDLAAREGRARSLAEARGQELRERLYRSEMRLGTETMQEAGGVARLREIVARWMPTEDRPDLRGLEWYLLAAEAQQELAVWPGAAVPMALEWPAPTRLVSTHWHSTQVWDARSGAPGRRWDSPIRPTAGSALSQDGRWLAQNVARNVVAVTDVQSGEERARFEYDNQVIHCTLSADGSVLGCHVDGIGVVFHDTVSRRPLVQCLESASGGMAVSTDGSLLAAEFRGPKPEVRIYRRTDPSTPWRVLSSLSTSYSTLAFDPAAARLASASHEGVLLVWSVETGQQLCDHQHPDKLYSVAFAPSGEQVAAGCFDSVLYVHDLATASVGQLRGHTAPVNGVAWSPEGDRLASISDDGSMRLWSASLRQAKRSRRIRDRDWGYVQLRFSSDGRELQAMRAEHTILWDLRRDEVRSGQGLGIEDERLRHWSDPDRPGPSIDHFRFAAICPHSGTLALVAGNNGPLWLWQTGTPAPVQHDLEGDIRGIDWLPGRRLAVVSTRDVIQIIDGVHGEVLVEHKPDGPPLSIAAHPTQDLLAIGCGDQSVRFWFPGTGETIELRGHTGAVSAVAFSADGTRLASGGRDQTVRLWDAVAHAEVGLLRVGERVAEVAFDAEGVQLGALDFLGHAVVWGTSAARDR